jgi:hypothetical protein
MGKRVLAGAIAGALAAFVVDYQAFRSFKSIEEFASYDWKLAAFRLGQGALSGAVTILLADYGVDLSA